MIFLSICKKTTVAHLICTLFISTINSMENQPVLSLPGLIFQPDAIKQSNPDNYEQIIANSKTALYISKTPLQYSNYTNWQEKDENKTYTDKEAKSEVTVVLNEYGLVTKFQESNNTSTTYFIPYIKIVYDTIIQKESQTYNNILRNNFLNYSMIVTSIQAALLDINNVYWKEYKHNQDTIYPALIIDFNSLVSKFLYKDEGYGIIESNALLMTRFPECKTHYLINDQTDLTDILTIALIYQNKKYGFIYDFTEKNIISFIKQRMNYKVYEVFIKKLVKPLIDNQTLSDYLTKSPNLKDELIIFKQSRFKYIDDFFYLGSKIWFLNFLLKYFFTKYYKDIVTEESDKSAADQPLVV